MPIAKVLAAVVLCLPAWAGAAPDHPPTFACTAALEAYAPGSWSCGGSLSLSGGTLAGYDSLIFIAKDSISLKDVRLQAVHVLLSAGSIDIDADTSLEVSGNLALSSNLLPAQPGQGGTLPAGATIYALPHGAQPGVDRIWSEGSTLTLQIDGHTVALNWSTLSLVPEPAAWQLAALGGSLLLAARARRRARGSLRPPASR